MFPNVPLGFRVSKSAPCSSLKPFGVSRTQSSDSFHAVLKIPPGDTPYVRAKYVQLVDKDPERALPLFWSAINAGDRVDSALKDMAVVMMQLNRPEEAIEAIRSLRDRCSYHAQEALDNILLGLFKKCGRLDDQIAILKHKLCMLHQWTAFNGKRTKTARSQGKKSKLTMEQEATRLLGNLGWALMQQENYNHAQYAYMQALMIEPDNNKMCNLGICLIKQGQLAEGKRILQQVTPEMANSSISHLKAFERAQQMLSDLESERMNNGGERVEGSGHFDSVVCQPQPCRDPSVLSSRNSMAPHKYFADENFDLNGKGNHVVSLPRSTKHTIAPLGNSLNIDAPPFYSSKGKEPMIAGSCDNSGGIKRTRSSDVECTLRLGCGQTNMTKGLEQSENKHQRCSPTIPEENEWDDVLPGTQAFEEAIMAAAVGSIGRTGKKVN